jgi:hypothetical protein
MTNMKEIPPVDKKINNKHNPLLLPVEADVAFSKVSDYGFAKYGNRDTWLANEPEEGIEKYLAACVRHAKAHIHQEEIDPESGLPHIYAVLWNAAAVCYHYQRLIDDRETETLL